MRLTFCLLVGALLMLALSGCPGPAAPEADTGQPAGDTGGSSQGDGGQVAATDGSAAATDAGEEPAPDGSTEPGDAGSAGRDASKPSSDGGTPSPDGSTVVTEDGGLSHPDASTSQPDAGFSVPDAGGVPPSGVAAFCAAYMDAAVQWAVRCYGATETLWRAALDSTTCDQMVSEVGAGRAAYDPTLANACLAGVATMPCDDTTTIGSICGQVVYGKATAGQPCYVSLDCAPKGNCTATGATCPGVCQDFLTEGHACGGSDTRSCASPLLCQDGFCKKAPGENEACSYTCAAGLWCDYDAPAKTCKKLLQTGESCTTGSACGYGRAYCKGLVYYPLTPGTCQPTAGLGEACTPGENGCQMFMSCDETTSRCAAYGSLGEPCGSSGAEPRPCLKSWCNSDATPSVCTAYDEPGDACTANSCRLGSCVNGFCESQCVGP